MMLQHNNQADIEAFELIAHEVMPAVANDRADRRSLGISVLLTRNGAVNRKAPVNEADPASKGNSSMQLNGKVAVITGGASGSAKARL